MAMSAEHKAALAKGRQESRAIKAYLEALGSRRPGRPVTPASLKQRLGRIEGQLGATTDPLKRVALIQQRIDTNQQLETVETVNDLSELESGFVNHAKGYSERKGITYAAWREAGVPAAVLKRTGLTRRS